MIDRDLHPDHQRLVGRLARLTRENVAPRAAQYDASASFPKEDFDDLFRAHLREVYTLIGQPPPETLDTPIRRAGRRAAVHPPSGHITPTIDGLRASNEWADAGHFIVEQIGGAMHHADAFERRVWFGSDDANFYIRFDTPLPLAADTEIRLTLHGKRAVTLSFTPSSVAMAASIDTWTCPSSRTSTSMATASRPSRRMSVTRLAVSSGWR